MNFESCRKCGTRYEIGYPCPTCTTQKQQERLHQEAREHSDDLAKRRDEQNEADRDYNENLFEREQAAAEERSAAEHRRNEEQTERLIAEQRDRSEEFTDALEAAEYARANPGDYQCPSCLYITLKKPALRCPICRASVGGRYWSDVESREREVRREAEIRAKAAAEEAELKAKAAAEEWKRGEPARLAADAKQAAAERTAAAATARLAAKRRRAATWGKFWKIYFIYLLPILSFQAAALIGGKPDALLHQGWQILLLLCPGLNWLAFLGLVIGGGGPWQILMFLLLAGGVGFILTRSFSVISLALVLIGGFFIVGLLYTRGFTPQRFIDEIRASHNASGGKTLKIGNSSSILGMPSHEWNWASGRLSLRGFGPIRIGMTLAEARSIGVGPLVEQPSGSQNCFYVKPSTAPEGLQFMVSQGRIARIDITTPAYASVRGARVGQTQEMVTSLYSGQLEITKHKYDENGFYLTFRPKDTADQPYRLQFETDGKQITKFRVGRLPEVEQVEGCS